MIERLPFETFDNMLLRFKREQNQGDRIQDYKRHLHYMSKGKRRRMKKYKKLRKF